MSSHLWGRRRGAALLALALASAVPASSPAASANACTQAGVTTALSVRIFGPGAYSEYVARYTPVFCEVVPKRYPFVAAVEIYLYPRRQFGLQLTDVEAPPSRGDSVNAHPLLGLGPGAVFVLSRDHAIDDVLFRAGGYAVELTNNAAGGQARAVYPTEAQYLALARAIRSHLR